MCVALADSPLKRRMSETLIKNSGTRKKNLKGHVADIEFFPLIP